MAEKPKPAQGWGLLRRVRHRLTKGATEGVSEEFRHLNTRELVRVRLLACLEVLHPHWCRV